MTSREREVLLLIAEGCTSREIAGRLQISPKTVEAFRAILLGKTRAKNSVQLVLKAQALGWLDLLSTPHAEVLTMANRRDLVVTTPKDGSVGSSLVLPALLRALQQVRDGNFSVRLPVEWSGLSGKIADAFNDIVSSNARIADELERLGRAVGKEGKTRQRVSFGRPSQAWGEMEATVNALVENLIWPTTEVTRAIAAVAEGDLSQTVRLDVEGRRLEGEFLRSATIVNSMIAQLGVFARRSRGWRGRWAPDGQARRRRRRCRGWPGRGRTSPTT